MKIDPMIQQKLADLGFYKGAVDGFQGPITTKAIRAYQASVGLKPDGWAGVMTIRTMFGPATEPVVDGMKKSSLENLSHVEPELQSLIRAASKLVSIEVLDSRRGKAAQEYAFNHGFSKVHFGNSAHNYDPSLAVDVVPDPLNWNDKAAFLRVNRVIGYYNPTTGMGRGLAKDRKVSVRWLGDPNMDGDISDGWDFPHYERFPWRKFANRSKLYKG
jgi:peptidoglycan hydrolase-like protein with peptidoglycan-binding domain